jgi:hypothetical protein
LPLVFAVILAALSGGCADDDDPAAPADAPDDLGVISGVVGTLDGEPLAGAVVRADGVTTTTSAAGYFVTRRAPLGDVTLEVTAAGHAPTYRVLTLEVGRTVHLPDLVLPPLTTGTVSASAGGSVSTPDGRATLDLPPGAVVQADGTPYAGSVTVELAASLPDAPWYLDAFPGEPRGLRLDGRDVPVVSHGLATVRLSGAAGEVLDLADARTATLTLAVAGDHGQAPTTMPAWWFDPMAGEWQEGPGGVRADDVYTTEIPGVGSWHLGAPVQDICILAGVVEDADDQPVPDVRVIARSVDRAFRDEVTTGPGGTFEVRALASGPAQVRPVSGSLVGDAVRVEVAEQCPLALPEPLTLPVPEFTATLTWGAEPADLDAHLLVPATWDPAAEYAHVGPRATGTLTAPPYAHLAADVTAGHGPEVLRSTRVLDGRYQLWVHDASGQDSAALAASGAVLQLEVRSRLHLFRVENVDLADAAPGGWWHVTDLVLIGGEATVDPVMSFQAPAGPLDR